MKNKEKYIDDIIKVMKTPAEGCSFRIEKMFRSKDGNCPAEMSCSKCNIRFYQWLEEEYEPKVDWKLVPMNTIIEVRDDEYASWNKRTFVFYDEDSDYPYVCIGNATSNCNPKAMAVSWKYARLPEEVWSPSKRYLKEE
jgi:hypothetical protein